MLLLKSFYKCILEKEVKGSKGESTVLLYVV